MEPSWYQNRIQNGSHLVSAENQKNLQKSMNFNDFWGSGGSKINEKSIKNRIKFEAQDEVPPGIDF